MSTTTPSRFRASLHVLIAFVIAFDLAYVAQKFGGAYESEFGAHPDEAAHYVTGLFVRDAVCVGWSYAAGGFKGSPSEVGKEFADSFYGHYPKVALGVWPPAFYVAQSAWTLPFGVSRTSLLLFMAFLAACVATVLYRAIRTEFGEAAAIVGSLLWLSAPLVRMQYGMIMAETLSTLAMLGATLTWGKFLDGHRVKDALAFAVLASIAILTKATGLALALMCVFSLILGRKWRLVFSRGPWIAAAVVALVAGPWTWYFRDYGTKVGGWADNRGGISLGFTREAVPFYAREIVFVCGIAVATFAAIGAIARLRGERTGRWAALTSLVIAVFIFQSLTPVGMENRHILTVAPAMVMLAIAGADSLGRIKQFGRGADARPRSAMLWVIFLFALTFPLSVMDRQQKGCSGFAPLAEEALSKSEPGARVLVSSEASGEGMFISEVAMRDHRPNLIVERASKSLVQEKGRTWDGRNLRVRFEDDEELLAYLTSGRFAYLVLDDAVPEHKRAGYHDQIKRVIEDNTGAFWPVAESPVLRDNELMHRPARLYRVAVQRRGAIRP